VFCQLHIAKSSAPLGQSYIANFPSSPHFALLIECSSNCPKLKKIVDCPRFKVYYFITQTFVFVLLAGADLIGNLAAYPPV
jgi:hypothetical protein